MFLYSSTADTFWAGMTVFVHRLVMWHTQGEWTHNGTFCNGSWDLNCIADGVKGCKYTVAWRFCSAPRYAVKRVLSTLLFLFTDLPPWSERLPDKVFPLNPLLRSLSQGLQTHLVMSILLYWWRNCCNSRDHWLGWVCLALSLSLHRAHQFSFSLHSTVTLAAIFSTILAAAACCDCSCKHLTAPPFRHDSASYLTRPGGWVAIIA